ncbi:MAG: hypothetical protein JXX28_18895 [Deltaproteobacteria bacterium]|nr:hypothetical protein [Deltaproteobacteria bacterium]
MRLALILSMLLGGCSSLDARATGGFFIKDRSCDVKLSKWSGDLTQHLLEGGGDGDWGYDPDGLLKAKVGGEYDFVTGDFSYTLTYAPEHWRVSSSADGYGYANRNGDLDVAFDMVTEDVQGDAWQVGVRTQRVGCEETQILHYDAVDAITEGTYTAAGFDYTETLDYSDGGQVTEGLVRPDGTWTQEVTQAGAGWSQVADIEGDADGYSRSDWSYQASDSEASGFTESFLDGTQHTAYDISGGASWDYTVDYLGDGSGTYRDGSFSCDLSYDRGECTASCNDGQTYACS